MPINLKPAPANRAAPPALDERALSYVEAVREAADLEMARDAAVVLFGLDVDDPKAIQGTTRGLLEKYGPEPRFRHTTFRGRYDRRGRRHGVGRIAPHSCPYSYGLPDVGDESARQRRR